MEKTFQIRVKSNITFLKFAPIHGKNVSFAFGMKIGLGLFETHYYFSKAGLNAIEIWAERYREYHRGSD